VGTAVIRLFGDPCLRRRAVDAAVGAPETQALLDTLWATLSADGGVGLAAPQIGVNRRVVVIRDPERPAGRQRVDLVNPVVVHTYGPSTPFEEGCLSFPGLYTMVLRPQGVEVAHGGTCPEGPDQRIRNDGLLARIIQHEVDHLDGVLFVDHLSRRQRWLLGPWLAWITAQRIWGGWRRRLAPRSEGRPR
jgi:peptide deformylase